MGDTAWKTREDAVLEVGQILGEVKRIQPSVGELLNSLKARLVDSNRNLAAAAAKVIGQVATCMGPPFERQVKAILPSLLKGDPYYYYYLSGFLLTSFDLFANSVGRQQAPSQNCCNRGP